MLMLVSAGYVAGDRNFKSLRTFLMAPRVQSLFPKSADEYMALIVIKHLIMDILFTHRLIVFGIDTTIRRIVDVLVMSPNAPIKTTTCIECPAAARQRPGLVRHLVLTLESWRDFRNQDSYVACSEPPIQRRI